MAAAGWRLQPEPIGGNRPEKPHRLQPPGIENPQGFGKVRIRQKRLHDELLNYLKNKAFISTRNMTFCMSVPFIENALLFIIYNGQQAIPSPDPGLSIPPDASDAGQCGCNRRGDDGLNYFLRDLQSWFCLIPHRQGEA